jgi:hypothetical protein
MMKMTRRGTMVIAGGWTGTMSMRGAVIIRRKRMKRIMRQRMGRILRRKGMRKRILRLTRMRPYCMVNTEP